MRQSPLVEVLLGDGLSYDQWARTIAAGDWYGTQVFYQAPLYPYALALVYRIFGADPWHMRAVQALIDSGSCVILAAAGRRFFSPAVGAVAGLLLALYGPSIFFTALLQKAVLDVFLTTLLLLIMGQALRAPGARLFLAAGGTVGLLALSRENLLVLALLLPAWALLQFHDASRLRRLSWAAVAAAGTLLVLAPVGLRNLRLGGEFQPTTSNMGPNFYIGNHSGATGSYVPLKPRRGQAKFERIDATELAEVALGRRLTPREVSRYWLAQAGDWIRSDPGGWAKLLLRKWVMVWNRREYQDTESIEAYREWSVVLRALSLAMNFGVVVPLAAAGVWLSRARWRELRVLIAMALAVAASIALFFVLARFRAPLLPVLMLFAAAALTQLLARRGAFGRGAWCCLLLCAAAVNWPLRMQWDPRAVTYQNTGIELLNAGKAADRRGDRAAAVRRYGQAEECLRRVLPLLPPASSRAGETHRLLGLTLQGLGRRDEALGHLRRAMATAAPPRPNPPPPRGAFGREEPP